MPLPGNVSTGTVVARFIDSAGDPATGKVTFTPSPAAIKNVTASPSPTFILPRPVTVTLDVNGSISAELVATDDPDNNPVGWTYTATFSLGSNLQLAPFSFSLPSGSTTNLAVVAPVTSSNGAAIIARGVPTGGAVGQVLRKASSTDYDAAWGDDAGSIPTASTTTEGKVELATTSEATTGTDTTRAVTPAGLKAAVDAEAALARNASNLTSGTVADARIASTIARDSEVAAAVTAHKGEAAAHAASNIAFTPTGTIAATTVQAAIAEVAAEATGGGGGPVAAENVSFTPAGTVGAATVQAAIEEVSAEAAAAGETHRVYSGPGASEGYDTLIDLDYDATSGTIPESVMIRAQNPSDVLTKAFWINEAGQPRVWTVAKDEPALKLFAFANNNAGKVLTVQDRWDAGTMRWAINGKGQVVLGNDETVGGSVVVLDLADPVPLDLPEHTLIVRRGAGGSENLLVNPSFDTSVTGWSHAADGLTWQSGAGSDGSPGFARMTASGTGSRNIQATLIPATAGDVLSVEGDVKWVTGTPKQMSVMIRFLDAGGSQITNNIGTLVTPGTGAWSTISSLNAVAPALTANAQIQVRINSAALSDAVDLDDFWVNVGSTIDRTAAEPGTISVWNGASEIVINDGSGAGGSGDFATVSELEGAIAGLADVAESGAYSDLTGTPVLPVCLNATKPAAQDFTVNTFANDTHLVLALPVGTFDVELLAAYDATAANDAKFQFTFSGAATCILTAHYPRLAAAPSPATSTHSVDTGSHAIAMSTGFGNAFLNAGGGGVGIPMPMKITGRVTVTSPGNLQLQVAKQANTDTGTPTRTLAGSYLTAVELVTSP